MSVLRKTAGTGHLRSRVVVVQSNSAGEQKTTYHAWVAPHKVVQINSTDGKVVLEDHVEDSRFHTLDKTHPRPNVQDDFQIRKFNILHGFFSTPAYESSGKVRFDSRRS